MFDFDTPFGTDHCNLSEGNPLVLHFSEPVKGVNASTVGVNYFLLESEICVWRPISPHGLQATTWVTLLKLPSTNFRVGETYTVQTRSGRYTWNNFIEWIKFLLPHCIEF